MRVFLRGDLRKLNILFSNQHLIRLEKAGKFPKRFALTEGGNRIAWVAAEVESWLKQRAAARVLPQQAPDEHRPTM